MAPCDALVIQYRQGLTRDLAGVAWRLFAGWIAWFWLDLFALGLIGVGAVCVASTRALRREWQGRSGSFILNAQDIRKLWVVRIAICIESQTDGQWQRQWLCRDECTPAQWALVLRFIYRHVPNQALGLSISN